MTSAAGTRRGREGVMCAYGGPSDPQLCTAGVRRTPCRGSPRRRRGIVTVGTAQRPLLQFFYIIQRDKIVRRVKNI
jgi:hypothetical protein